MSEWIKGNGSQINQLKSWLSDARRVNVAREIERIENINPSEAVAMYRAWEGRILSMMQQGLVSAAQEIWISYSDRDLAHEILRKQWSDQFRQRVAKSDSELRDAALRKRARKNQKTKTSGGRASSSPHDGLDAVLEGFVSALNASYGSQLEILRESSSLVTTWTPTPVTTGRQALIHAFESARLNQRKVAVDQLRIAQDCFDSGAVKPDSSEWFIDGPEIGRGHSCMWGGITRVFAHKSSGEAINNDYRKADAWFGTATLLFLQTRETKMAGRAVQEWAESRRLIHDLSGAASLFQIASTIFNQMGDLGRAKAAAVRIGKSIDTGVDSAFFLGRPPTESEVAQLTTILGGRNSTAFHRLLS